MKTPASIASISLLMIVFTAFASNGMAVAREHLGPGVREALDGLSSGATIDLVITFKPGVNRELLVAASGLRNPVHFESFPVSYAVGDATAWTTLARNGDVVAIELNEQLEYHMQT